MLLLGFLQNDTWQESGKPSWKRSLPHVLVATLTAFLFGYHIGYVFELFQFCLCPACYTFAKARTWDNTLNNVL